MAKEKNAPPTQSLLDGLVTVWNELAELTRTEQDPLRANKLRGVARRFGALLNLSQAVLVDFEKIKRSYISQANQRNASRPRKRGELKQAIFAVLKEGRRKDQSCKEFLNYWRQQPLSGLHLIYDSGLDRYRISDWNGDLGERHYQYSTLENWYSQAKS